LQLFDGYDGMYHFYSSADCIINVLTKNVH